LRHVCGMCLSRAPRMAMPAMSSPAPVRRFWPLSCVDMLIVSVHLAGAGKSMYTLIQLVCQETFPIDEAQMQRGDTRSAPGGQQHKRLPQHSAHAPSPSPPTGKPPTCPTHTGNVDEGAGEARPPRQRGAGWTARSRGSSTRGCGWRDPCQRGASRTCRKSHRRRPGIPATARKARRP